MELFLKQMLKVLADDPDLLSVTDSSYLFLFCNINEDEFASTEGNPDFDNLAAFEVDLAAADNTVFLVFTYIVD